jgi:hypothetical protein
MIPDDRDLTKAELEVVTATARGDIALVDPSWSADDRIVDARLLRQLLLKLPRDDGFGAAGFPASSAPPSAVN